MVAAKPTSAWDLRRVRQHQWDGTDPSRPTCRRCGLALTDDLYLADVPACPGSGFALRRRGAHESPAQPDTERGGGS